MDSKLPLYITVALGIIALAAIFLFAFYATPASAKTSPPAKVFSAVAAGETWCGDMDGRCYKNHRAVTLQIYNDHTAWIERSAGGFPGLFMASTASTESGGRTNACTKSKSRECGITSIDLAHSRTLNVNPFDPRAAWWAAGYQRNSRLLNLLAKWPALANAPIDEQWKVAGAAGAIGTPNLTRLLRASHALDHARPYTYLVNWMRNRHAALARLFGKPGKKAFRVARVEGRALMLGTMYPQGIPWGAPFIPLRPVGLLPFPGDEDHGNPELVGAVGNLRPTPPEQAKVRAYIGKNLPR